MAKKQDKLPDLETSMTEITQLIDKMEHGELTLEQSLAHFERGVTLITHCQKTLTDAEQKVQILIQQNQQEKLSPYQTDDDIENDSNDDTD